MNGTARSDCHPDRTENHTTPSNAFRRCILDRVIYCVLATLQTCWKRARFAPLSRRRVSHTYICFCTILFLLLSRGRSKAKYYSKRSYDLASLEPVVAKPHSPDNRALAKDCRDTKIDRVYIGSCTGGKTEDFAAAARILQNKKVQCLSAKGKERDRERSTVH